MEEDTKETISVVFGKERRIKCPTLEAMCRAKWQEWKEV
jgi:hypothetical protein